MNQNNNQRSQGFQSRNPGQQGNRFGQNQIDNNRFNNSQSRSYSPNNQGQSQNQRQRQPQANQYNYSDNNYAAGGGQGNNRNMQTPKYQQGGQRNQQQQQNQGYPRQQNSRSRSGDQSQQNSTGINSNWNQQRVSQQRQGPNNNMGSNNQRMQNTNTQFRNQPRQNNPQFNNRQNQNNMNNPQNRQTQQGQQQRRLPFYGGGITVPPKPGQQGQQNNVTAGRSRFVKKGSYANRQMKDFINDKEESQQSNSKDVEEEEDNYDSQEDVEKDDEEQLDSQDGNEEEDNHDDEKEEDDNHTEEYSGDQEKEDYEDENGDYSGDGDDDGYQDNSEGDEEDDDNRSLNNEESNSWYNQEKHSQNKQPVRELTIKKYQKQPEMVGIESNFQGEDGDSDIQGSFKLDNFDVDKRTLAEQEATLAQMCHEMINERQWEEHIQHHKKKFAFFERNMQGEPQKHLAMKFYYRSAAAKELNLSDILSPIAIKKSSDRMINEILDYFLSPKVNVKNLVLNFTDRLRTLTTELEPLSQHLFLFNNSKMMVDVREHLLLIHIASINYLRQQSCLRDSELENGYDEKKFLEQIQTLSDSIFNVYEENVEKIKDIIEKNKHVDMEVLKKQILENSSIYISPLFPKMIAWRLLIRFSELESLHKMDSLLYLTYDSLVKDSSFCSIFELISWVAKNNHFKYFEYLNTDKRLDYLSANASLILLANVRRSYILLYKLQTSSLTNLQFDLDNDYDKESAEHFLNKLGTSLQEVEDNSDPKQKDKIDKRELYVDSIHVRQSYWPNFYSKMEWRRKSTFKETIRSVLKDAEDLNFPETLIENMIRKDRGLPSLSQKVDVKAKIFEPAFKATTKPDLKPQSQTIEQPFKVAKPTLNLPLKKTIIGEQGLQPILNLEEKKKREEEEKKKKEEEKRNKMIEKWGMLIGSIKKNMVKVLIDQVDSYCAKEFQESYLTLKYFEKWRQIYNMMKYNRHINKYRNQQRVCYGINNSKISFDKKETQSSRMEIEERVPGKKDKQQGSKASFTQSFLKAFNEKEKLLTKAEVQNFFDMVSINFLKEKNKMFTHLYYKITIVSNEENPIIERIVKSFKNYLSKEGISQDQNLYSITITIEDITIEYSLQLQMSKYLKDLETKELSGSDLFIYIFDERDDQQNQAHYSQFRKHLEKLNHHKNSMGFNLLFLSVNEVFKGKSTAKSSLFSQNEENSNLNKPIKGNFLTLNKPTKGMYDLNMSRSTSNQQMNKSISSNAAELMMLDMDYTNPDLQDSEGYVRRAIKYILNKFDLKKDTEENPLYQYYNVISYTYESFDNKCINENPFSERIFKASVDSAIQKSIRVKSPFGKITSSSFSIELQKIRQILSFGKISSYAIPNKIAGLPPISGSSGSLTLYKQLKDFLIREEVLDVRKHTDMKNFFYFRYLFNDTLYQLFENFLGIMGQSHLIPFDQLNEFDQNQLLLLEQTLDIVKDQLDRVFIRKSMKQLKSNIRKNYFTSFSYENVVQIFDDYYKNLLEINSTEDNLDFNNDTTLDSMDFNQEAYQSFEAELVEIVKKNFSFEQNPESGVVGNWQAVFIKLLDQLILIFEDNDIPLFLSQNFQFKFDNKKIKKDVSSEIDSMNQWLHELKEVNEHILSRYPDFVENNETQIVSKQTNKKIKTDNQEEELTRTYYSRHHDSINIVEKYNDLVNFSEEYDLKNTQAPKQNGIQLQQNKIVPQKLQKPKRQFKMQGNNGQQKPKKNGVTFKLEEKQQSLSYSESESSSEIEKEDDEIISEISSDSDSQQGNHVEQQSQISKSSSGDYLEEDIIPVQNKNLDKRRTACLVQNSKEQISSNLEYTEKIKKLMRGEIAGSPTHLDDSFV